MCVQFPVTVPINGVISCEDFDQNFQSLKAFVDAFCNLDEIVDNIEMWAAEAEASAEAAELALSQIQTIQTQLQPLVDAIAELLNLEANLSSVLAVEAALVNINTVASNIANVNTVAAGMASIVIVATNIANVNTVANDIVNVNNVATNIANVNTVANDIVNVNTVATNIGAINNVEAALPEITTVEANLTDITIVAGDIVNVNTVANNMLDLLDIVANLAAILDAENQAIAAAQSAADAIAAANTIAGQIDFTGAVEGDLLRHNGSEFVRISRQDLGQQKQLFLNSVLATLMPIAINAGLLIYDNFASKATVNPSNLVSDSGHTPIMLIGTSFQNVITKGLRGNSNPAAFGYSVTVDLPRCNILVSCSHLVGSAEESGFIFWVNSTNYFEVITRGLLITVNKVVGGVSTVVWSIDPSTNYYNLALSSLRLNVKLAAVGGNMYLFISLPNIMPPVRVDMTTDISLWGTITRIGLIMKNHSTGLGGRPFFEDILIQKGQ